MKIREAAVYLVDEGMKQLMTVFVCSESEAKRNKNFFSVPIDFNEGTRELTIDDKMGSVIKCKIPESYQIDNDKVNVITLLSTYILDEGTPIPGYECIKHHKKIQVIHCVALHHFDDNKVIDRYSDVEPSDRIEDITVARCWTALCCDGSGFVNVIDGVLSSGESITFEYIYNTDIGVLATQSVAPGTKIKVRLDNLVNKSSIITLNNQSKIHDGISKIGSRGFRLQ